MTVSNIITLSQAKTHLRVSTTDEDDYILMFIYAAHDYVRNFINQAIPTPAPAAIKSAILLIVGDMYENREAQSDKEIYSNPAVDRLLYPYRVNIGF